MRILSFIVLLLLATSAQANSVFVDFSGNLDRMREAQCEEFDANGRCTGWDSNDVTSSTFYEGQLVQFEDVFSGSFNYDSASPVSFFSDEGDTAYYNNGIELKGAVFAISTIGMPGNDLAWSSVSNFLAVTNDDINDGADLLHFSYSFTNSEWFSKVSVLLKNSTGTLFDDFSVPTRVELIDFDISFLHWSVVNRSTQHQFHAYSFQGISSVSGASAQRVPEINANQLGIALTLLLSLVLLYREREGFQA